MMLRLGTTVLLVRFRALKVDVAVRGLVTAQVRSGGRRRSPRTATILRKIAAAYGCGVALKGRHRHKRANLTG